MNIGTERPWRPNADECEQIFHAALAAGDAQGVEAALTVMAPQDPRRAIRLYDELKTALAVTRMLGLRQGADTQ